MARKLTERQRYWFEHIQASKQTGGTMKAYAEAQGLVVQELYHWKSWLGRKGVLDYSEDTGHPLFERLMVESAQEREQGCRLILPNGVVVEMAMPTTAQGLKALLRAAGSLS